MKRNILKSTGMMVVAFSIILLDNLLKISFWWGFLYLPFWVVGWQIYNYGLSIKENKN